MGAYEIENLKNEIKWTIIEEDHFTELDCPFKIEPTFPTLVSIVDVSRQEPLISFFPDASIRDFLVFDVDTILEEYNLLPNPVDIL